MVYVATERVWSGPEDAPVTDSQCDLTPLTPVSTGLPVGDWLDSTSVVLTGYQARNAWNELREIPKSVC